MSMSRTALTRSLAVVASLVVVLAIVGTAAAQRTAVGGYTVQRARLGSARRRADHRPQPRQPVGHRRRADLAVVGGEQRDEHVDPLQRRRPAVPARLAARRRGHGQPDRDRLQRRAQFLIPTGSACRPPGSSSRPRAGRPGLGSGTAAQLAADRSPVAASYTGLAIAGDRLYAADFHNHRVDVFDGSFHLIRTRGAWGSSTRSSRRRTRPSGSRTSAATSSSPTRSDAAGEDEVAGRGLGVVDEYDATACCSRASRVTASSTRRGALRWRRRPASAPVRPRCSSATSATGA